MSYGLIDMGNAQKRNAMKSMSSLVDQEAQRNATNRQLKTMRKNSIASGVGMGASIGMMAGGPMGAAAGAVLGGLAVSLF